MTQCRAASASVCLQMRPVVAFVQTASLDVAAVVAVRLAEAVQVYDPAALRTPEVAWIASTRSSVGGEGFAPVVNAIEPVRGAEASVAHPPFVCRAGTGSRQLVWTTAASDAVKRFLDQSLNSIVA